MYFKYDEKEINYLKSRDKKLAKVIEKVGSIKRKAEYIIEFSENVINKKINLSKIKKMSDEDAINELVKIKGIGVWTAEMILLFCLQRPNIFSYGDLAIKKGLMILYKKNSMDKELFEKYRKKFSPYCSIASLYLWAIAGGVLIKMND